MKKLFIQKFEGKIDTTTQLAECLPQARTRREALAKAPWASALIAVDGGWIAFETAADAATWRRQK